MFSRWFLCKLNSRKHLCLVENTGIETQGPDSISCSATRGQEFEGTRWACSLSYRRSGLFKWRSSDWHVLETWCEVRSFSWEARMGKNSLEVLHPSAAQAQVSSREDVASTRTSGFCLLDMHEKGRPGIKEVAPQVTQQSPCLLHCHLCISLNLSSTSGGQSY